MPISSELKTAYQWHKGERMARAAVARVTPPPGGSRRQLASVDALAAARADVAAGKPRYQRFGPCISYQPDSPRGERLAHVESPEAFGLRYVGQVGPESRRFTSEGRGEGWLTDPFGDVFKDGTGLCYGVVYQLPARDGCARFVAGYQFGGIDGGPTLDLATVYTSESARGDDCKPVDHDDARDAARAADHMAQRAAEKEREYQTGWQLGRIWEEAREEATAARREALALLAERRAARGTGEGFPAICAAIRGQVRLALATITTARETMRKAVEGDGPHGLCVYMGADEKAAFCEAAGLATFPAESAH